VTIVDSESGLFKGLGATTKVWMSHGDQLSKVPEGFKAIAHTATAPFAAVANIEKQLYGMQFHPEVTHSVQGKEIIKNFVLGVCGCKPEWTMVCTRYSHEGVVIRVCRADLLHRSRD